jgi:hypothetical protein
MIEPEFVNQTFRLPRDIYESLVRQAGVRRLTRNALVIKYIASHEVVDQRQIAAGGGSVSAYKRGVMSPHEYDTAMAKARETSDHAYWLGRLANITKPAAVPPEAVAAETNGAAEPVTSAA